MSDMHQRDKGYVSLGTLMQLFTLISQPNLAQHNFTYLWYVTTEVPHNGSLVFHLNKYSLNLDC